MTRGREESGEFELFAVPTLADGCASSQWDVPGMISMFIVSCKNWALANDFSGTFMATMIR